MLREVIEMSGFFIIFVFFKQINKRSYNNKIIINEIINETSIKIYKIHENLHISITIK